MLQVRVILVLALLRFILCFILYQTVHLQQWMNFSRKQIPPKTLRYRSRDNEEREKLEREEEGIEEKEKKERGKKEE